MALLFWQVFFEVIMNLGFFGVLTILFIALKLLNVIAWSWVWVLAPMWIGVILWFAIAFIILYSTYSVRKKL